jgi:hypothetical protein
VKSVKIVSRSSLAKAGGAPASAKHAAAAEVKSVPAPASTPASTDAAKAADASASAPAKTEPAAPPPAATEAKPDSAK